MSRILLFEFGMDRPNQNIDFCDSYPGYGLLDTSFISNFHTQTHNACIVVPPPCSFITKGVYLRRRLHHEIPAYEIEVDLYEKRGHTFLTSEYDERLTMFKMKYL